jgi:hypothetical protein
MAKSNKVEGEQGQSQTEEQQKQSQIYDTSMKELVDRQAWIEREESEHRA